MPSTIIPSLRFRDAPAAIEWLTRAFGLHAQAVYPGPDNTIAHAQLTLGEGMVMLGSAPAPDAPRRESDTMIHPEETGNRTTVGIYLVVPDAAAVHASAVAAGARIVMPLQQMPYGGAAFGCLDLEGHTWSFGEYDPWAGHP